MELQNRKTPRFQRMKRTHRSIGLIAISLAVLIGLLYVLVLSIASVEGGTIEATIDNSDFLVENDGGANPAQFEPVIRITNNDENDKTIVISATIPEGPETDLTKDVYPHIFTDDRRRHDKGMTYRVDVPNGDTRFYPRIDVNQSAFADIFEFKFKIDNEADSELIELPITVEINPWNEIKMVIDKDDKDITITAGRVSIISVTLENMGNIYKQKVNLEIDDLPSNLTLVEIQFPALGTGVRDFIYPESSLTFNDQSMIIVGVKLSAFEDSGEGTFDFDIRVDTPDHDPSSQGFQKIEVRVKINPWEDPTPPPPPDPGEGEFPVAVFAAGLVAIIGVMGGAGYFMFNKGEDSDESGWGEGEGWGADEWGGEESYDSGSAAEEYEAPITERRAGPKPRPAPGPVPRTAPAAPRPSGPAHVKCPKCKTGVKVSNPKRPLTIGCPKCSTKFTLKGKPGAAPASRPAPRPAAAPKPAGPAHVKCPKCHTGVKVSNPKRPLTIGCPKCSTKFTLKGKPGAAPTGPAARPPTAARPKGPALIACPKCSTKFKVSNPKRPLKVACPRCKTGLNLK